MTTEPKHFWRDYIHELSQGRRVAVRMSTAFYVALHNETRPTNTSIGPDWVDVMRSNGLTLVDDDALWAELKARK